MKLLVTKHHDVGTDLDPVTGALDSFFRNFDIIGHLAPQPLGLALTVQFLFNTLSVSNKLLPNLIPHGSIYLTTL